MNLNHLWKPIFLAAALGIASFASFNSHALTTTVADAAAIYAAKCAKCHGSNGAGVEKYKKQGVKDFTDGKWQKSRSDAQFTASIKNGKGEVMPAWKAKLSEEEIKALVAFVRAFKK
ncbi:MAG TPA: c-type cytochrome [Blastocatellia bacterium]|nr:c-type cytochrome [Blastocatellia bacterium]